MIQNSETLKTWDLLAEAYRDGFMELDLYNDTYDQFLSLLVDQNAELLEIGCGPGNITSYLLQRSSLLRILAIDTSPNMLKLAAEACPQAKFKRMDARQINTLSQKFDGLVCGFCIPYLTQEECLQLVKDAAQILRKNGIFYLSFIEDKYENSAIETSSDGKYTVQVFYHEAEFFEKAFKKFSFQILYTYRKPYIKKNGSQSTHLIFITRLTLTKLNNLI